MSIIVASVAVMAFLAILFLQSGMDKVLDFKGNLSWLQGHFGNSPLKSLVTPMVVVLTILELASGAVSAIAVVYHFVDHSQFADFAFWGLVLCALSFLALFFGQRMAKDYAGAASIPSYFLVCIAGFILLSLA